MSTYPPSYWSALHTLLFGGPDVDWDMVRPHARRLIQEGFMLPQRARFQQCVDDIIQSIESDKAKGRMFGAALGPLFHGAGSLLGRRSARKAAQADVNMVLDALPAESPLRPLYSDVADGMKAGSEAAYKDVANQIDTFRKTGIIQRMREATSDADRMEIARAMELALTDVVAGRAVDVSPVLKDSRTISNLQVQTFIDAMESGEFVDVNFGKLRPDYKAALNEIRTSEGVPLLSGDDLIIPANVVKKLHTKRMLQEGLSADRVAEILLNVFHRDADFAAAGTHPHIQAVVALRKELAEIGFISVNPKTGETVIKSGFITDTKGLHRKIRRVTTPEGRGVPSSEKLDADASHLPVREFSALQGGDPVTESISAKTLNVNEVVRRPDFRPEAPEAYDPLPLHTRTSMEAAGIDPHTGASLEEAHLAALDEQGKLAQADKEALLAHTDETTRINQLEEASLAIAECVMKVIE